MNNIKIILAEDEPSLGQIIKESLESRNFDVLLCENGEVAYETYKKERPELLVLDVMMPKKDGFTLAKEIRLEDKDIPIIFLTSKSQTKDVVEGFNLGGNDYLKKPFSMEELIVRMNSLLTRQQKLKEIKPIKLGKFIFDLKKQTLQFNELTDTLTHREAHLLHNLIMNKNQVLERSVIFKKIMGRR